MFKITFELDSDNSGQLLKTLNVEVSEQILVLIDVLFPKGGELQRKNSTLAENLHCSGFFSLLNQTSLPK